MMQYKLINVLLVSTMTTPIVAASINRHAAAQRHQAMSVKLAYELYTTMRSAGYRIEIAGRKTCLMTTRRK